MARYAHFSEAKVFGSTSRKTGTDIFTTHHRGIHIARPTPIPKQTVLMITGIPIDVSSSHPRLSAGNCGKRLSGRYSKHIMARKIQPGLCTIGTWALSLDSDASVNHGT